MNCPDCQSEYIDHAAWDNAGVEILECQECGTLFKDIESFRYNWNELKREISKTLIEPWAIPFLDFLLKIAGKERPKVDKELTKVSLSYIDNRFISDKPFKSLEEKK